MKVRLEKKFPLTGSADLAWRLLQDIEAVAGCMPGAQITERVDAQNFKGRVAVKFGPASMSFRGEVQVVAVEPADRTLRLLGKGTDSTGSSGASMDLTARIEAIDAVSCHLVGTSEVSVSGKAAAFGGRMMGSVADQVLKQFAANFDQKLGARVADSPADSEEAAKPGAAEPAPTEAIAPVAPGAPVAAVAPVPLNGLALAWSVIKDWVRSWFSTGKA